MDTFRNYIGGRVAGRRRRRHPGWTRTRRMTRTPSGCFPTRSLPAAQSANARWVARILLSSWPTPPGARYRVGHRRAFRSSGEKCTATSRVIVEEAVAQEMTERIVERAAALQVGNPLDPEVFIGPLVDETQCASVLEYIEIGNKEGAELLTGGERVTDGDLARGWFVEPDATIAQEEIFGPVVSVLVADDFDHAVRWRTTPDMA